MECYNAWEDDKDECAFNLEYDCEHDFFGKTSDMICQCVVKGKASLKS